MMRRALLRLLFLCLSFCAPLSSTASAQDQSCTDERQQQAARTAQEGLTSFRSFGSDYHVGVWRRLVLHQSMPLQVSRGGDGTAWWSRSGTWAYEKLAAEFGAKPLGRIYGSANFGLTVETLKERVRLLGASHPYVKEWVANQAIVLSNLRDDIGAVQLPVIKGQYAAEVQALAADDIGYQRAAAYFYATWYKEALSAFREIADSQSRYRDIAAYMVVRTLIRAGQPREALGEIDAVLKDQHRSKVHIMVQQLYGFLRHYRADPDVPGMEDAYREAYRRALLFDMKVLSLPTATIDADPELGAAFADALFNLSFYLRSDLSRPWQRNSFEEDWWIDSKNVSPIADAARENEMLDWLQANFISSGLMDGPWSGYLSERVAHPAYLHVNEHIAERMQTGSFLPWFILLQARSANIVDQSFSSGLRSRIEHCEASDAEQFAAGIIAYHEKRAYFISDNWNEYWSWDSQEWWTTTRSAPYGQLRPLAERIATFGFADRKAEWAPALTIATLDELAERLAQQNRPDDALALVNMLPMKMLITLVENRHIPAPRRAGMVRMAWTRAYLLGNREMMTALMPLLAELNPDLIPLLQDVERASTEVGRDHAVLRLLLGVPAMNIRLPFTRELSLHDSRDPFEVLAGNLTPIDRYNPNDSNWWCSIDPASEYDSLKLLMFDEPLGLAVHQYSGFDAWRTGGRNVASRELAFANGLRAEFDRSRATMMKLHPLANQIDWQEFGALSKIEAAPTYLGRQAIAWAKDAGWFDRWWEGDEIAEALALTVRATRWGCTRDGSDAEISRQAYVLLHQLFPDSEAAARTRYWYN